MLIKKQNKTGSPGKNHMVSLWLSTVAFFLAAVLLCAAPLIASGIVLVSRSGLDYMIQAQLAPREQRLSYLEARVSTMESLYADWSYQNMRFIHLWPDVHEAEYLEPGGISGGSATLDAAPRIVDGRTMVPLRFVGESLGADVSWDGENRQISYTTPTRTIILTIDQRMVLVGNVPMEMDTAPIIIDERAMVPVRFIASWLGAVVRWDEADRRIEIGFLRG